MPTFLRFACAALVSTTVLASTTARAEADDVLRDLRIRFAHGQSLEIAGRWADALERFEEVARVHPTPQVTFHAALCLDHLGRLLAARDRFHDALVAARSGAPEVVHEATEHLADLDARIPRVTVALTGALEGVVLQLDGEPVDASSALALDPGPHLAVAMRDGGSVAALAFSVAERDRRVLPLAVLAPRVVARASRR